MKIRAVLNGIAALAAVGVFYTFAFCMVDDVDDTEISQDYYYNTATDTITAPAETVLASANKIMADTYNMEKAEAPKEKDVERVNQSIEANHGYMAAPAGSSNENDSLTITPLFGGASEETITTSVPASAEEEVSTESAGADIEMQNDSDYEDIPEDVPEDIEDDIIVSENRMDNASEAYVSALSYNSEDKNESIEEINRKMAEMQMALTQTLPVTVPEVKFSDTLWNDSSIFTTAPLDIITSSGTYFETVPSFGEPETTESIVTTAPSGSEIFTAKVDGSVQEFDAYQLVCMIVSTEMSPSFSKEALKAQAVAAYSYVKYHNVNGLVPSVLVKRDVPPEVTEAVNAVWGKCCYYNGNVAQTVYTASSAGTTASAVNVWGGNNVPYLTSVSTPFDIQSDPNYGVISTFSESYIKSALESSLGITLSDDPSNWLTVTSRVDGNYVSGVNVDGQVTVSGRKIRESVLKYGIKSWCFDVSYADGEFTFVTYGYGHGVGMSQNGANILGKQGYTYDQILTYYFPGTTVE